jgi:hypothetical protein
MPRAKAHAPDKDFKQIEKYVRQAPARLLPRGWIDWPNGRPPLKHKLAIDEALAQLPSGRKKILSADEVRARYPMMPWPSHEIAIRFQLTWYANFEFLDSILADAEVSRFHIRQRALLRSADASLLEFLKLNAGSTFHPLVERELTSNVQSAIDAVQKLNNLVDWCLRERRPRQGGRPVPGWKRKFVLRLAAFWQVITDSKPGPVESSFANFVSGAWYSFIIGITLKFLGMLIYATIRGERPLRKLLR